jgi:hypothetical protein
MRYFFDIVGYGRSELDYTGRILPTPKIAYDAAELMAFDLIVKRERSDRVGRECIHRRTVQTFLDPGANVLSGCHAAPLH